MAIIIPPNIIKEYYHKIKLESQEDSSKSSPGEEAHIYNLYEELSMPISDIIEIGKLALEGKLENVQEKMDGQFLAFTVVDGQLRFFTKMDLQSQAAKDKRLEAIRSKSKGGGMNLDEIMSTYTGGRSNIAEGFAIAYQALEPIVIPYQDTLFRNGEVVIASQIMVAKNPNTILYDTDSLRTVKAISLTDEEVNRESLSAFEEEMKRASTDAFTMDKVPTAKLMKGLEIDDSEIENLEKDLEKVVADAGLNSKSDTVGDYVKSRVESFLSKKYSFIPDNLVSKVADRFVTGKGKVALELKKKITPEQYQTFRALDKSKAKIVQEAIIPLEEIIQRLGVMIIDKLDLALTAGNHEELLGFIKDARAAFEQGKILGDEKTLDGIRVALARMEANQELLSRATEGIVFTYNNKTYKLTGLFTPVNRLRGFFGSAMGREGFGKASLPDSEPSSEDVDDMLSEIIHHTILTRLSEDVDSELDDDSDDDYSPEVVATGDVSGFDRDLALKILAKVIAKCPDDDCIRGEAPLISGKRWDDVFPLDGGTVGIGHFASDGLPKLYDVMTDDDVRETGMTVAELKSIDCKSKHCYNNIPGWKESMKRFTSNRANQGKQLKAWLNVTALPSEDEIKGFGKRGKRWQNDRGRAIAYGIANSMGAPAMGRLAKRNKLDPEKSLADYRSRSGHNDNRAEKIDKFFPVLSEGLIAEGGNAFKRRDEAGKKVVVTSADRIKREQATRIMADLKQNLLDPLKIGFLPAGSTGTDKQEIGDIDLIVSEPDKDTLYQKMLSAPYLSEELVEGVPRVLKLGQLIAIMVQDSQSGQFFQVDLFPSDSMDDTAWELSGGGEGKVKGEYHKLMLSLLAKIKGERESSQGKIMKYTISFPGGWREKINGKENEDGRIPDPDNYLSMINIDVPKDQVKTFENLIAYMTETKLDEFREALDRFESYIGNRLGSKSESVRKAAQKALEHINAQRTAAMSENSLRNAIRSVLSEETEDASIDIEMGKDTLISPEKEESSPEVEEFNSAKTWAAKTRAVQKILSSTDFLGSDFEKSIGGKAGIGLMRFGLKPKSNEKHDFSLMMNKLYDLLSPGHTGGIKELAPNEGNNPSSSYIAYQLPDTGLMILFGIAGVTGGQRKAGYEYEIGVRDSLESSGIEAAEGSDNSLSDIYVPTAGTDETGKVETLGIEVKLPNAQAGEPTLAYDFDQGVFVATNPKPQNKDIANLINTDPSRIKVGERLKLVMDAINAERRESGKPEIESLLRKISRDEYVNIAQPVLNANPVKIGDREIKGALLAVYKISAEILRKYYMLKKAGLVQIKGKGLFHLDPSYKITVSKERETQLFEFPDAYGAVYFRNFRGGNYGIRSQLTNSPLKKLPTSGIDLDNEADRKDFISVVKKSTFPDPKNIAKSLGDPEEIEASEEENLAETLRKMIREIL
jgi:hypothetical protein